MYKLTPFYLFFFGGGVDSKLFAAWILVDKEFL